MTDRLITIKAFGNKRTQYNAPSQSAISNVNKIPLTPFRAAMNAGDEAGSVNSGVLSHLYAPSQANGIGNMSKHFNPGGNSTGESAYTGNQKFVYDGSDYTRFKKLQAFNRERGAATAVFAAAASITNIECLTTSSAVNVISSGGNKYRFNGDTTYVENKYYGLGAGTFTFTGVPSGHPIAILNAGKTSLISYTGDNANKSSKTVSGTTSDGTYDFYHGDVTVTVSGDFGSVSVYCVQHGYMGGENLLRYSSTCSV